MSAFNRLLRRAALGAVPLAAVCASASAAAVPAAAAVRQAAPAAATQPPPAPTQRDIQQLCHEAAVSTLLGVGVLGPFGVLGPWGPLGTEKGKPLPDCPPGSLFGGGILPAPGGSGAGSILPSIG
jgi:hypothetical protein